MREFQPGQPPAITIRIDRLRIRLTGADEATARVMLAGLGPELARQLLAQEGALTGIAARTVGNVTVPVLRHNGSDPGLLRTATARAIAGTVLSATDCREGSS